MSVVVTLAASLPSSPMFGPMFRTDVFRAAHHACMVRDLITIDTLYGLGVVTMPQAETMRATVAGNVDMGDVHNAVAEMTGTCALFDAACLAEHGRIIPCDCCTDYAETDAY